MWTVSVDCECGGVSVDCVSVWTVSVDCECGL